MQTTLVQPTVVDVLRHGQVQGGSYYRGSLDEPLSTLGWQQMRRQCLSGCWDAVMSSPLRRCSEFAQELAEQQKLPLQIEAGWREIHFGDWEGQTAEQISREHEHVLRDYYADPLSHTPPNAEPYALFNQRIHEAWLALLSQHAGQKVLIVTHGGVIRALFAQLLGLSIQHSFQIDVPHACMTRFSCFHDEAGNFVQLNYHKPD